jgi:hypothetical protein
MIRRLKLLSTSTRRGEEGWCRRIVITTITTTRKEMKASTILFATIVVVKMTMESLCYSQLRFRKQTMAFPSAHRSPTRHHRYCHRYRATTALFRPLPQLAVAPLHTLRRIRHHASEASHPLWQVSSSTIRRTAIVVGCLNYNHHYFHLIAHQVKDNKSNNKDNMSCDSRHIRIM